MKNDTNHPQNKTSFFLFCRWWVQKTEKPKHSCFNYALMTMWVLKIGSGLTCDPKKSLLATLNCSLATLNMILIVQEAGRLGGIGFSEGRLDK